MTEATMAHGRLLFVEDDPAFARVMARALTRHGFEVIAASTIAEALQLAHASNPRFAVVDLKLGEENGLALIPVLHARVPAMRIVLLTGYASIATAVEAIKLGAQDYLAKPIDAETLVRTLLPDDEEDAPLPEIPDAPIALRRLEWEHIQRTLQECSGNISQAARRLGMHRRTLQRKLLKHPVRERPVS
ncbi:MAG TPA: response regulator [Nevskiaceae bacterium]